MTAAAPRDWIAVACATHVRRGMGLGVLMVCHGKLSPLRRIHRGDRVVLYSPSETMGGGARLQSFTALGIAPDDEFEQVEMEHGFRPWRRRLVYLETRPAPIAPLRDIPGFALAGPAWGARLRFGLLPIDPASMDAIAQAMGAG